jgi:hypothetical protein
MNVSVPLIQQPEMVQELSSPQFAKSCQPEYIILLQMRLSGSRQIQHFNPFCHQPLHPIARS